MHFIVCLVFGVESILPTRNKLARLKLTAIIQSMNYQVAGHQIDSYFIRSDVYEGPLDLLLQLIERAELDITRLAIAQVTDQYLEHIKKLDFLDAAEVSAFLVMAARLVQMKSAALLPHQPQEAALEEDPAEALAQQLVIYKKFKDVALVLAQREENGLQTFLRVAAPPKIEPRLDLEGITLADLMAAARDILSRNPSLPLDSIVAMPRITIRDRIRNILDAIRGSGKASFSQFFLAGRSRTLVVVTFLAMLELIKRNVIDVSQPVLFGEIDLNRLNEWEEQDDYELEFGE